MSKVKFNTKTRRYKRRSDWTPIIICVAVVVAFFGLMIMVDTHKKPSFRAYRVECRNETEFKTRLCDRALNETCYSITEIVGYKEVCEEVESDYVDFVDFYADLPYGHGIYGDSDCEWHAEHINESYLRLYCIKKIKVSYLTTEWLDENCECVYACFKEKEFKMKEKACSSDDRGINIEETCPAFDIKNCWCEKYKCGDVSVEVLR